MIAPSVAIDHPIEEIGITNNQLETPKDGVGKVGWYNIYPKPGFLKNAVFAAHVNYNFKQGPFANLAKIKAGDKVTIQMQDGPAYVYEVIFYQRYDVNSIPMGELIDAPTRPANEEWITLITCGGRFQQTQENGLGEYLDRDVVIAPGPGGSWTSQAGLSPIPRGQLTVQGVGDVGAGGLHVHPWRRCRSTCGDLRLLRVGCGRPTGQDRKSVV